MRNDTDIEEAIDRYGDAVLRACSAYLSSHDAEDVFQETFLRYANRAEAFNDEEHRKAWLIRVAVNLSKDRLRAASSKAVPLDEIHGSVVESEDDRFAERERMRVALRQLSDDQRLALMLSVVQGYTVPEIAAAMDKPENTVYSHITRGKKRLREVLGDD